MQPHSTNFNPGLEGLRGLAILLVLVFHAMPGALPGGFIGVDIFFVLSGFLITRILLDEHQRRQRVSLKAFYLRRCLRLMPALTLLLGAFIVFSFITYPSEQQQSLWGEVAISAIYMTNWARAFDLYSFQFLGHTWSLAIEEQFYMLWPGLLCLLLRSDTSARHLGAIVLAIIVASALWRAYLFFEGHSAMRVYNGLDTRADGLMLGAGLAVFLNLYSSSTGAMFTHRLKIAGFGALLLLALLASLATWDNPLMIYLGYSLTSLLSTCLIAHIAMNREGQLGRLFSGMIIRWTGQISYGLYLWHFPIYCTLLKAGLSQWQTLLLGIPLSFAAASISYYLLEKPCLRLKKRYSP